MEAGQLAEDYRQEWKVKHWEPNRKDMPTSRRCHACGMMGHIAKDCGTKGEQKRHKPVETRKDSGLTCYDCNGKGHTSRQCPSKVMYCGARRRMTNP